MGPKLVAVAMVVFFFAVAAVKGAPPQAPPLKVGLSQAPPVKTHSDCTGGTDCECWKTWYVCPRDGQGGCRCRQTRLNDVSGPIASPPEIAPPAARSLIVGHSVTIPPGFGVINDGPDAGKLIPLTSYTQPTVTYGTVVGSGFTCVNGQCYKR